MGDKFDYKGYLELHRQGVISAFEEIYLPVLKSTGMNTYKLDEIRYNLEYHDKSKLRDPEFKAYADHWDNGNSHTFGKDIPEYQYAWNHHQKSNPHHWQYWVLLRDSEEPRQIALDMPFEYIIEMLCDWQSASKLHAGNTAVDWYNSQKDNMILSPKTREIVEKYLKYIEV